MTFIDKYRQEFIERIRHYSQDEGYKDHEIGEILGCSRATVNRTRRAYDIPIANLENRKDKEINCQSCEGMFYIRRKERKPNLCDLCGGNVTKPVIVTY